MIADQPAFIVPVVERGDPGRLETRAKLRIDFWRQTRIVRTMTDAATTKLHRELIQNLCLEAGRLMEDVSADMALTLPSSAADVQAQVDQLHRAAEDILALASAARALAR